MSHELRGRPMRIGVIGTGRHASANLYPSFADAGLELVATCARRRERAAAAAKRWGAPHAFDDPSEMLASVELDGVVVCVQPPDYAPLVRLCLETGAPVFTDKPGGATAADADELSQLSVETGVPVVVGWMKRFAPAYQRARELIRSDAFGQPTLGTFTFAMGRWHDDDLRGYLIDNPGHHLDLARYLLGELSSLEAHVLEVPGVGWTLAVIATAASGALCTFNFCTTASWEHRNEYVEVYGAGHAVWVDNVERCTYRPPDGPEQTWRPNFTVPLPRNSGPTIMGFLPELEHFRAVVMDGAPNRSDMASAARTLALAERLCAIANV